MVCLDRKIRISRLLLWGYHILYIHMTSMYIYTHIRRSHFLTCEEPCESVMIEGPHESRKRWQFAGFRYFLHFYKPSRQGRTKGFDRTTQRQTSVLCKEIGTTIFTGKHVLF